jgi:hypothetical protein
LKLSITESFEVSIVKYIMLAQNTMFAQNFVISANVIVGQYTTFQKEMFLHTAPKKVTNI